MFKPIRILILISFGLIACDYRNETGLPQLYTEDSTQTKETIQHPPDGHWMLTNYLDSILKDKSIAKHRLIPLSWNAAVLNVANDSLFTMGILYSRTKNRLSGGTDSMTTISAHGTYTFRYDPSADNIMAIPLETTPGHPEPAYRYRRVTDSRLLAILEPWSPAALQAGLYQLLIDSLIAGEFKSNETGQTMTLNTNGLVTSFKNYNKYHIHDYFGTLHPYQNLDAIIFEDTTALVSEGGPPSQASVAYFNWTIKSNRLTLTEMETKDFERYYPGKKKYTFTRLDKQNK